MNKASSQLAVRKVKRTLEWLAYGLFDRIALLDLRASPQAGRVAVVHLELLGDALIWLPYGQALLRHLQEQGKRAVCVLDAQLEAVLKPVLPNCLWVGISRRRVVHDLPYRWRTLRRLRLLGVEQTILMSYPRDALIQDAAVRALAGEAFGSEQSFADRPRLDIRFANRGYAHLTPALAPDRHQNHRHRAQLCALGVHEAPAPTMLPEYPRPLSERYCVIAPGASRVFRQWTVEHFAELALRLAQERPHWRIVVLGAAGEKELGERIRGKAPTQVWNLTGQTDLAGLLAWIAHAELVIGNDSAPGHIAAAYGVPSVMVVGGGHWGRCYPYDPAEAPVRTLPTTVGEHMPCFGCDWLCVHTSRTDAPYPCITAVQVEKVWQAVQRCLAERP